MKINSKCARAVAAILGAHAAAAHATAADQSEASAGVGSTTGIEEVIVTAQRRTENAQNVPIAMQVFTAESLQQLNINNFDDLLKYLPNVTAATAGPGQAQVFMRGLSVSSQGTQSGGSINSFPNVAIYLDDRSAAGAQPRRVRRRHGARRGTRRTAGHLVRRRRAGRCHSLHHEQAEDQQDRG
jgi:outer membrane receptor protein involved in Fe transport